MKEFFNKINPFIQKYFTYILVVTYIIAILYPEKGIILNTVKLCLVKIPGQNPFYLTPPMIFLGMLIFNAALSIDDNEVKKLPRQAPTVLLSIIANFLLGLLFFFGFKLFLKPILPFDCLQQAVTAIAVLTTVPIAGTAVAWTQAFKANVALSLGILFSTTLLSPVLAPFILNFFAGFAHQSHSATLASVANDSLNGLLTIIVVVPTLIGVVAHYLIGCNWVKNNISMIKTITQIALILLIYANSAVILPDVVFNSESYKIDFIYILLAFLYCALAFGAGWLIAIVMKFNVKNEIAMIFSQGMKNVGLALIIANFAFAQYKYVGLFIIFFAIIQQFMANYIKAFEYNKLKYIKNNNGKLACFIDYKCRD